MACRTHKGSSITFTVARNETGLTDQQTQANFHHLRREGKDHPAPTVEEWNTHIDAQVKHAHAGNYSPAKRRSILARAEESRTSLPEGPDWYAMKNLIATGKRQASAITNELQLCADLNGTTLDTMQEQYKKALTEVPRGRDVTNPNGFKDIRDDWFREGFPPDHATWSVLTALRAAADEAAEKDDRPRRVEHYGYPPSSPLASAGYDSHDGRLEVTLRADGPSGEPITLAYRGISDDMWADMNRPGTNPARYLDTHIRGNNSYQYPTAAHANAAAHRRCPTCGQWWAPSHSCPVPQRPRMTLGTPRDHAITREDLDVALTAVAGVDAHPDWYDYNEWIFIPTDMDRIHAAALDGPVTWELPEDAPAAGTVTYTRDGDDTHITVEVTDCTCGPHIGDDPCYPEYNYTHLYPEALLHKVTVRGHDDPNQPWPEDPRCLYSTTDIDMYCEMGRESGAHLTLLTNITEGRWRDDHFVNFPDPHWMLYKAVEEGPVMYSGLWQAENFTVTGDVALAKDDEVGYRVSTRNIKCTCPDYRSKYDCIHVRDFTAVYRSITLPEAAQGSLAGQYGQALPDVASSMAAFEERIADEQERNKAFTDALNQRLSLAPAPPSFTEDYDAFANAVEKARQREKDTGSALPYLKENVFNGHFTRESGRGIGVEIEYNLPPDVDKMAVNKAIAQALYDKGLTREPIQMPAKTASIYGYVDHHERGWSFEFDETCDGELISPVMFDEAETWEYLDVATQVLREHGASVNINTGSHLHLSTPHMSGGQASEVISLLNANADTMARLSQDKTRKTHRPDVHCAPNLDIPVGGYKSIGDFSATANHSHGFNLESVRGAKGDHAEFRQFDGTLNPAEIQANMRLAVGITLAAERNASAGLPPMQDRETIGAHAARRKLVLNGSRRKLTRDEAIEDTARARRFLDTVFNTEEDRELGAAMFYTSKWAT